jgi:hypothetical protein
MDFEETMSDGEHTEVRDSRRNEERRWMSSTRREYRSRQRGKGECTWLELENLGIAVGEDRPSTIVEPVVGKEDREPPNRRLTEVRRE